jgi:hypothetical protein
LPGQGSPCPGTHGNCYSRMSPPDRDVGGTGHDRQQPRPPPRRRRRGSSSSPSVWNATSTPPVPRPGGRSLKEGFQRT